MDDVLYPEGKSIINWVQPEGEFFDGLDKDRELKQGNVSSWVRNLVFNEDLYIQIKEPLSAFAEFLPVMINGDKWYVLSVTHYAADVVDMERSEKYMEGAIEMGVKNIVFNESKLSDELLFRTQFSGGIRVYCTDKFKNLMDSIGVKEIVYKTDYV